MTRFDTTELTFKPVYRGHDGVREFWREWYFAWAQVDFSYDEFIDAGDQVIVVLRMRMRGRSSGIELGTSPYVQIWTVSEGRVVRCEYFPTKKEALEAAGLAG
jgi:ketosteroid isomerase-like protein